MNEQSNYVNKMHFLGRTTTVVLLLSMISVPILMSLVFGIDIDVSATVTAFVKVFMVFGVIGIIEFFSYPAILGPGGMYLSFVSGNISNLKMPAAVSSMKLANVENGTKEGELVSTIAISVSTMVTTVILFVGMYFLQYLKPLLENPILKPGFDNLLPAIYGALAMPLIVKNPKIALAPGLLTAILTLTMGAGWIGQNQSYLMILLIGVTILGSYVVYKTTPKKEEKEAKV